MLFACIHFLNFVQSTQIAAWTRTRCGQPCRRPGASRLPETHEPGQSLPTVVNTKVHESEVVSWEGCEVHMLLARACKKFAHCVIRNIQTIAQVHGFQGQALAHGRHCSVADIDTTRHINGIEPKTRVYNSHDSRVRDSCAALQKQDLCGWVGWFCECLSFDSRLKRELNYLERLGEGTEAKEGLVRQLNAAGQIETFQMTTGFCQRPHALVADITTSWQLTTYE